MITPQLKRIFYWLIACHVVFLMALTFCRVSLSLYNMPADEVFNLRNYLIALLIGVKFDNLIASYIIAVPLVLLPLISLATCRSDNRLLINRLLACTKWYLWALYSVTLFICITNIRYYYFFDNHLNWQVTEWFAFVSDTSGMLFGEPVNWIFLLTSILGSVGIYYVVSYLLKHSSRFDNEQELTLNHYAVSVSLSILLWGLCFLGMRGSLQRYPLNISHAYFCDDVFYNRLGINPVFNIIKSAEYADDVLPAILSEIDKTEATEYVRNQLHCQPSDSTSTICRTYSSDTIKKDGVNVVLILMESMMSANLEREYKGQPLTPYLRALRDSSIYFPNTYSAGIHTNNGIMASQYGIMPNFAHTSMPMPAELHQGLPNILAQNGYSTFAFLTSNPQYDNMNSVLRDNGIQTIYSLYDYPKEAIVNNFGVSDDYLFNYGLDRLNEKSKADSPFYAMFLTVSNHMPYVVPNQFMQRGSTAEEQIIAYADDAVGEFLQKARRTEWGKNTLFIVVADHGHVDPNDCHYDMTYSFNHIPLYFVAEWIEPHQISNLACQIDIMPTVLAMLGIEFENHTVGIDLMHEKREYTFFASNEYLGCADDTYFWCQSMTTGRQALYRLGDCTDILSEHADKAAAMQRYAQNMMYVSLRERFAHKQNAPTQLE